MTKLETQAHHEQVLLDMFAAYELSDSDDFENRQKIRNMLRYQTRGYCFELPPKCSRYGVYCSYCPHLKCRDNERYDGEKWDHDFDPDVDRYRSLFDNLHDIADDSPAEDLETPNHLPEVDTGLPLDSLLASLAKEPQTTAP